MSVVPISSSLALLSEHPPSCRARNRSPGGPGSNNFGMKLDLEQSRAVVYAALDNGINLFDTSDSYGDSEQRLGEILQGKRDDILIATKFGNDVRRLGQDNGIDWRARGSRRYIRRA